LVENNELLQAYESIAIRISMLYDGLQIQFRWVITQRSQHKAELCLRDLAIAISVENFENSDELSASQGGVLSDL
jgi:hypothetical protein